MARTQEILANVRYRLNDTNTSNYRWSDTHLLRLLNSGLRDLSRKTRIITDTVVIPLLSNQAVYKLPHNIIEIQAVLIDDKETPIVSSRHLDKTVGSSWRLATTEARVTAVVYDKLNTHELKVYPTPENTTTLGSYTLTPNAFGFDVAIAGATNNNVLYGVVSGATSAGLDVSTDYGVFTGGVVLNKPMLLIYERLALPVLDSLGDPETPEFADQALEYYVAGSALRADVNQENRAFGADELRLYEGEIAAIKQIEATSGISNDHATHCYNGMGL